MGRPAIWSKSGSLERQDLVGCELLLIKRLLLLLQRFDLILDSNLSKKSAQQVRRGVKGSYLLGHDARDLATVRLAVHRGLGNDVL